MIVEKIGYGLAGFIAAFALFVVFSMFRRQKALEILTQDKLGFVALVLGSVAGFICLFLNGNWVVAALAISGFVAGFGALLALPKGPTEALTAPSNIWLVTALLSGVGIISYVIVPIWPNLVKAWHILWDNSQVTQALALVGFVIVIIFSLAMYGRRSK